ncbi:SH3 domain-containing protein [Mesorhizobium marinum]|uniref:SH3 domain-containing protein n=1 Tax=Mesorhizobium marinum TaxID=3228790 RepID=UPI003467E405
MKTPKAAAGAPAGSARITSAVNMRSAPRKGAGVLAVVPAGATVGLISCDGWCQIAYGGRQGWVYKSFLSTAGVKPRKQKSAETADAAPPQPARVAQSPRLN